MALYTFPLSLAQFFDLLPIGSVRFEPTENLEISETNDGVQLVADIGVALWQGTFILSDVMHEEALEIAPLINLLRRAGVSFLVTDPRRPRPRLAPQGLSLLPPPAGALISADPAAGGTSPLASLSHLAIAPPRRIWKGLVDGAARVTPAKGMMGGRITIIAASAAMALTRGLPQRYSDEAMRKRGADDRLFRYADVSGKVPVYWGEERHVASSAAPGGSGPGWLGGGLGRSTSRDGGTR